MDVEQQKDIDLYDVKADEMPTLKCLPMVNFIGVCLLALSMIVLWSSAIENGTFSFPATPSAPTPRALILRSATDDGGGAYKFNIREGATGTLMRLPPVGHLPIVFDKLSHYNVCCHTLDRAYFVCHSVTRNIGVDCVIQQNKSTQKTFASIVVQHRDMIGAMCVLNWKYKKIL